MNHAASLYGTLHSAWALDIIFLTDNKDENTPNKSMYTDNRRQTILLYFKKSRLEFSVNSSVCYLE